jgi:nucleoside phosphorylase
MKSARTPRFDDRAPCLVVSAWPPELDRLRSRLPARVRGLTLATVGVGLVEAAHATARLIAEHRPSAILLVGTAGVYARHQEMFPIGSAATTGEIVLLPDVLPGSHVFLPDLVPQRASSSPVLGAALAAAASLPSARVACPLGITASARAAAIAARRSGCALENLEAFAVARAAAATEIPFVGILGVANHVGARSHAEWKRHARRAAAAACDAVLAFLHAGQAVTPGRPRRSPKNRETK